MLGHVVRNHGFARSALFALCWLLCAVPRSQADDGFVKDAASGCAVFKPNLRPSEVVVWKGSCQNGVAEGHGVARWNAGDGATVTFEGKFAQGKLQGAGTMTASGGDRYDGNFKDGKRDGRGVYVSANRDRYEGEYKDNQRHGAGTLQLAFGNRAVGEWRNGTMVPSTSNLPRSAAPPIDPILTQPTRPALTEGWQAQLAQQAVQEQAARELRAQQRVEEQQRQQAAAQQRTQDRVRQQQLAQQAAQEQQRQRQLAQQAVQEEQRQRLLAQQNALEQKRRLELIALLALLAAPIAAAALITHFKSSHAVSISTKTGEWIGLHQAKAREKTGVFAGYFLRPVLWCFQKLFTITASIADPFMQAGIRIATWLYLAGAILFLIYWVTVIVLAIALLVAGFWVLGAILSQFDSSSDSSSSSPVQRSHGPSYAGGEGESRLREGLTGQYIEHTDATGNVVGRSRQREGLTGPYVEHEDAAGHTIAESRNREGLTGDYVEHQGVDGNDAGMSRKRDSLFGPYTEHQDAEGKVVGESRRREGLFGPYTEHKKVE